MDPNISSKLDIISKTSADTEVSDNVSVYIGLSLIGLGVLNSITDVPDAFIIGASLAGFFFTSSDLITLNNRYKKAIVPLTFAGVISFFLLPIVLLSYPNLLMFDFFSFFADMVTFVALGFVMVALGIKSRNAKRDLYKAAIDMVIYMRKDMIETKAEVDTALEIQKKVSELYNKKFAESEKEREEMKNKEQKNE